MTDKIQSDKYGESIRIFAWVLLFVAFMAVYYPVLIGLVKAWYGSDDYSHGFFILPLFTYMIWHNRTALATQPVAGSWFGLLVVIFALLMFLTGRFGAIYSLSSVSMVIFVWGAVLFLLGIQFLKSCLFPLSFLFFMIPVPAQIYAALTNPLQFAVTKVTVAIASLTGMAIYREGNVIHLPDMTFQVVQACSGLRSIMTMLTLGAIFGYFSLRSLPMRIILLAAGIPIAIAVNIFRVSTMVFAHNYFKLNLTEGMPHTILGLFVFALGLGFFTILQKGLAKCEK